MRFKRPGVRYSDTPPPATPYQAAAQVWDERLGSARVQAKNWRLMAFGCLTLAVLMAADSYGAPANPWSRPMLSKWTTSARFTRWARRPPLTNLRMRRSPTTWLGSSRMFDHSRSIPSSCDKTGWMATATQQIEAQPR